MNHTDTTAMTTIAPHPTHPPLAGRVLFGIVVVIALVAVGRQFGGFLPQFAGWVDGLGVWGPVIFIGGYAAATIALVPGSVLTLAAGAIFGLSKGITYVFIGATIGASMAFLLGRYIAREAIEQRLEGNPRFAAIDRAVGHEGGKIVLLLRLSPVFPFNLLNYALGLTNVRFADYALASVGMLPGTLLYTYYGTVAGEVTRLAGGVAIARGSTHYVVLVLGLVATVAVTVVVTRIARRALQDATAGH